MIRIVDTDYGRDADNNRGTTTVEYELTTDDTPEIRDEVFRLLREDVYEYTDTIWIQLMCPISEEDVSFDVEISEYVTKADFDRVQGEE